MIIPIGKKYRIRYDRDQWVVEEYVTRTCKKDSVDKDGTKWKKGDAYEEWANTWGRYYSTIENAVNALIRKRIGEAEAETLLDALNAIREICSEVRSALEPAFSVSERR